MQNLHLGKLILFEGFDNQSRCLCVLPMLRTKSFIAYHCILSCGFAAASGLPFQQVVVPILSWEDESGATEFGDLTDLTLKMATTVGYDSNVAQRSGTSGSPKEGDFMTSLAPSLKWARKNEISYLQVDGNLGYNQYQDLDQYSGLDSTIGGMAAWRLGRVELGAKLRQSFNQQVNRFYGGLVEEATYGVGFSAIYSLSPKTSLVSMWQTSSTDRDRGFGDTEKQTAVVSAMWRYSELLQIGPGIAYTRNSGEFQRARTSLGPTVSAVYQLSSKVSLNGQMGLDYVEYEGGVSDEFLSARIGIDYRLNELWRFDFSLLRDVDSDGSLIASFRETSGVWAGVTRKIRRASVRLGLGYENSTFVSATGGGARPEIDYLTADAQLTLPIWSDNLSAQLYYRYRSSSSDSMIQNWDAFQTGLSLIYQF
ncbi:MAG: hypothetical protein ABJQ29_02695 [Luteolibacter sp.]